MAHTAIDFTQDQIKIFAARFAETLDATEAYATAFPGIKRTSAKAAGTRFLAREEVKRACRELMDAKTQQANVGIERVLKELEAMAFIKLDDYAEFIETANGRTIPVLDAEKIKDNPMLMSVLTGKFKRIIDKDGGTHDVYELDTHNKQAALFKLMDYHLTMAGKLAPAANRPVMNFHVNFPIPGSGWRNKSQSPDPIDLEPIDQ